MAAERDSAYGGDSFSGTSSTEFARSNLLRLSTIFSGKSPSAEETSLNGALAAVEAVEPNNEIEAMLAVQMTATHELAMLLLGRLRSAREHVPFEANGNMAIKLLRTFAAQTDALTRLRRGGEQTVRVEHVHVHDGGQAIVGNVHPVAGGGASREKDRQPHEPCRTDEPGTPLLRNFEAVKATMQSPGG